MYEFFFTQAKAKQGLSTGKAQHDAKIDSNEETVFDHIGNTLRDACDGKKPEEVNIDEWG